MIAYCGIKCSDCKVFQATRNDCEKTRKEMAHKWSERFGWNLGPDDMCCDGCLIEGGRVFAYCKNCETRQCAREKAVENCAYCEHFDCDKLQTIWGMSLTAENNLKEIRKTL
jgi:hypothetical protein